ncbi:MAG TPA: hypothetical protein VGB38_05215 [bacterium]
MNVRVLWIVCFTLVLGLFSQAAYSGGGGTKPFSRRMVLGGTIGNWQPHGLNDEPRFSNFGSAGATPLFGLYVFLPLGGDTGFRLSAGYWSLRNLNKVESAHSLTLYPLSIDVKYWLVPEGRLSAYVLYGGSAVFGIENESVPFGKNLQEARSGWGVNLGAGFDLVMSKRIGMGVLFQYRFVRFQHPLGGVDDFSGPQIAGEFLFFL